MKKKRDKTYPLPSFDPLRSENLRRLNILSTEPSPEILELVRVAGLVAECPVAALSFIDKDRLHFKVKIGIPVLEIPREFTFCTYTILNSNHPYIVPDLTSSDLFKDHPLVLGPSKLKSYFGFPINSPDFDLTIGSLCVLDRKPKNLSAIQLKFLQQIAANIMQEIKKTL